MFIRVVHFLRMYRFKELESIGNAASPSVDEERELEKSPASRFIKARSLTGNFHFDKGGIVFY